MSFNDLARGTLLGGKYKVEGILGQGGMGSVYQAVNSTIGRTVAIKLLDAKLADNADFIHRFQMEAKAAALIGHPGIVDVLDMGETDEGMPFIVMEYLEGVTLKSLCKRAGALSAAQAVAILVPVLDALIAAHAAGVIHRDLKPANIFVCLKPAPAMKILDFGISKFSSGCSGITQTGTSMGTPAYMSPEQVRGERAIGPQSDLYSIGAILYNLVSGHPPFEGESDLAVVARVLTDLHRPLAELRPDLPPKLSQICDRLLIKQADQRPADAAQVKRALESVARPDYDAVWKAARVAFDSDTATGLKAQRESPTTPTTPTGGHKGKTKPSRPALARPARSSAPPPQQTRAQVEESQGSSGAKIAAFALAGLVLAGVGGFFTWKALQTPAPVGVVELPPKKAPTPPPKVAAPEVPAEPEQPAEPAGSIILTVTADPATARFQLDGEPKDCSNPCQLEGAVGKKAQLVVSADGYLSRSMELVFDNPREVAMALAPEPKKVVPGKKNPPAEKKKGPLSIDEQNPYK